MIKKIDPLVVGIVAALILGLTIPVSRPVADAISVVADVAVALVFVLYGMRLSPRDTLAGVANIKLHTLVVVTTFVIFPILGVGLAWVLDGVLGTAFALGIIYLAILPSTVQSAPSFVAIARGDVAAAITAATASNILSMVLTPALVVLLMDIDGAQAGGFRSIFIKLLLPFIIGQLLQPFFGPWVRHHTRVVKTLNSSAIVFVVLSAVLTATLDGVWSSVSATTLVVLVLVLSGLLAVMLGLTFMTSRAAGLDRRETAVLVMSGAQKSLATGLPMAKALFDSALVGPVAIPVIIYHQLQLIVCAVIAQSMRARD